MPQDPTVRPNIHQRGKRTWKPQLTLENDKIIKQTKTFGSFIDAACTGAASLTEQAQEGAGVLCE